MKKLNLLIIFIALLFVTSSCAMYGSEEHYESGDFWGVAGAGEVSKIKRDKLAIEKLRNSDVKMKEKNGEVVGYEGLVVNFHRRNRYTFILSGPEEKSHTLGAGKSATDYLIPGTYLCTVYRDGRQQGDPWLFHVTSQLHNFDGREIHWYVYME